MLLQCILLQIYRSRLFQFSPRLFGSTNVHSTLRSLSREVFSRRGSTVGPGSITMKPKISSYAYRSKLGCKDQESIQSSTTPDPGYQWKSDKLTVDTTNESQEVSPFPAGDHKAHINRRAQRHSKHKTKQKT